MIRRPDGILKEIIQCSFDSSLRTTAELLEADMPGRPVADHTGSPMANRSENRLGRPVVSSDLGDRLADHLRDVGIAAGSHREPAFDRKPLGLSV